MKRDRAETTAYRILADLRSAGKDPAEMTDRELLDTKGVGPVVFCAMMDILSNDRMRKEESLNRPVAPKKNFFERLRIFLFPESVV